jgi:hypothetical protein
VPLSYAQYAGNGSTTTFSVPFPYLLKAHVKLYTGFSIISGTYTSLLVDGTDYTWTSSTQVQLSVAPANGVTLTVLRDTPDSSQLVPWQDGSNLIAEDLNIADLQNLYVVQEQQDRNDAGITQSTAAAAAATAATTAANTATSTANAATSTANTALSTANTALSTANTASTNASAAVSTANTASSNASAAVTTANAASATANTASTNASNAVTTANAASAAAASATTTANTAASNASTALSTANTASSNAAAAVSTANTASTNASNAVSTANTASSNASTALSTANTAASNASTALSNSTAAVSTANSAAAAVAAAIFYTPVIDLAALGALTPANGDYYELQNSTGAEVSPLIVSVPGGLVGAAGITMRLRYDSPPGKHVFLGYYANDSETRYAKLSDARLSDARTPTDGSVTNAKVAAGAAIDPSKIAGTAVVNADTRLSDARTPTDGSVTNAKVAAGAAIAGSKIDANFAGQRVVAGVFIENTKTVSSNYTIPAGRGVMSVGHISIASGATVTVSYTSNWVIL